MLQKEVPAGIFFERLVSTTLQVQRIHGHPEAARDDKEIAMKHLVLVAAMLAAPLAWAHNCPVQMKAIDEKLGSASGLSDAQVSKAKQLRAEGEKLHKEGKHDESMKTLQEAKKVLGMAGS